MKGPEFLNFHMWWPDLFPSVWMFFIRFFEEKKPLCHKFAPKFFMFHIDVLNQMKKLNHKMGSTKVVSCGKMVKDLIERRIDFFFLEKFAKLLNPMTIILNFFMNSALWISLRISRTWSKLWSNTFSDGFKINKKFGKNDDILH